MSGVAVISGVGGASVTWGDRTAGGGNVAATAIVGVGGTGEIVAATSAWAVARAEVGGGGISPG